MAEQNPSDDSYADFPAMLDPVARRVLERAERYQHEELDITPDISEERLMEMLDELNSEWPFNDEKVVLTGQLQAGILEGVHDSDSDSDVLDAQSSTVRVKTREDGQPELCAISVNTQVFESGGITIDAEDDPFLVGGEAIGKRYVFKLLFRRNVSLYVGEDSTEPVSLIVSCTSRIGDVAMRFARESDEFAQLRSWEYFPDCAAKLDELSRDPTLTPSQIIMALRRTKLPTIPGLTTGEARSIEQYATSVSGIRNEDVSYIAHLRKNTPYFDPENPGALLGMVNGKGALLSISGLQVAPRTKVKMKSVDSGKIYGDLSKLEFSVNCIIHQRNGKDDIGAVNIRVKDIKGISNLREVYYPDAPEDETAIEETE